MTVLFALLSALSTAGASVFQRRASLAQQAELPHAVDRPHWWARGVDLVRRPLWLLGIACMAGTLVFSSVALYFGTLVVVQPLLVTELVFTLALRHWWLRDRVDGRSWGAAAMMSAGLAAFLVVANPSAGLAEPSAAKWTVALVSRGVLLLLLLAFGSRGSPRRRAALVGAATGLVWSVDAGFVKSATGVLARSGWSGMLVHWSFYAAVVTGLLGTGLLQWALSVGPLVASQPAIVIVDPLASITLGIELFGERISRGGGALALEGLALAVMVAGILLLSVWAPPVPTGTPDAMAGERL